VVSGGSLQVVSATGQVSSVDISSLPGFAGSLGSSSGSLVTVMSSSSGMKGIYEVGPALRAATGLPTLASVYQKPKHVLMSTSSSKIELQGLSTAAIASVPGFSNPTLCIAAGGGILFDLSQGASHYPVYQKDNLLNTNPNFDYSQFRALATTINNNMSVPTMFGFSFNTAGTYVFADATDVRCLVLLVRSFFY
jgi:hypothetical protein